MSLTVDMANIVQYSLHRFLSVSTYYLTSIVDLTTEVGIFPVPVIVSAQYWLEDLKVYEENRKSI